MKKQLTLIVCASLIFNIGLAQQWQNVAANNSRPTANPNHTTKNIESITGSISSLSNYIPSATTVLNFSITFASPDQEYLDGLSMTFPAGMTPIITGTSNPLAPLNSGGTNQGTLNTISGQTISWGALGTNTLYGFIIPGTYTFAVGVTSGAITGIQTVNYVAYGDGYQSTPHSFSGSISIDEASTNDVGVVGIIAPTPSMAPGVVTPQITVQNFGSVTQTNIPVNYKIGYGGTVVSASIASLAPGVSTTVSFPSWTATNGTYNFIFYTNMTGDASLVNDTIKQIVSVTTATWTAVANAALLAYMGSGAICSGNLYAMAGNQPSAAGAAVAIYNITANTWAPGPALPAARVVGMAAATSTKVYYMGGNDGTNNQNTVWELTPPGTVWFVKTPLPALVSWARTAVYQDSLIYVMGGYDGTNVLASVYLYNTNLNTWRTCTSMPLAVFGGAAGITGNTLVYTSGSDLNIAQTATYEGVINPLNHAIITWTLGAPIPSIAFKSAGGTWGQNEIIVATGCPTGWLPTTPNPCYAYNPATNIWRTLPNKTTPTLGGFTASFMSSFSPTTETWQIVSASGYDGTAAVANTEVLTEIIDLCTVNVGVTVNGITMTANAIAATYQWLDCNHNYSIIPGETGQSFTPVSNGGYAVMVTQGLCSDTSVCTQITTVGINTPQTTDISIFPNPVTDELIIDARTNIGKTSFEISNSIGEIVRSGNFTDKIIVQTGNFSKGIYLIKFENGKTIDFKKIIKE